MTEKPNGNNASPLQTTRLWRNPIVVVFLFLSLGFLVIVQTRCLDKKKEEEEEKSPTNYGFLQDLYQRFFFFLRLSLLLSIYTTTRMCVCKYISQVAFSAGIKTVVNFPRL